MCFNFKGISVFNLLKINPFKATVRFLSTFWHVKTVEQKRQFGFSKHIPYTLGFKWTRCFASMLKVQLFYLQFCPKKEEAKTLLNLGKYMRRTLHDVWAHWSYIWAQKNPTFERKKIHDWAHFTLAIYLRKKNYKTFKKLL